MLLEDPDTVSVLELVKEKLSGKMVARLLEGSNKFLFIYLDINQFVLLSVFSDVSQGHRARVDWSSTRPATPR